ncbi:GNAT family N-acetyltransferase [Mesobacillus subterraneus]|uniref:GNAT family N-acetyltransferase n=1 Tax=Mesobacillus subterraneus TaxID=285983 RepID=A0A3R9FDC8_9BACI|nr:GNAT family N-acetyltransferase [Mesobacillus subterraneus]RSD25479.1 GNAT family N-acetyltransferase [Mesobacillus subterraneus]
MKICATTNYTKIAQLNKTVHDMHVNMYPECFKEFNQEEMEEAFKNLIGNERHTFIVLEDEGEAVGYAWYEIKTYDENVFKKGYVSLYVHQISIEKRHQSKGYGTFIMEYLFAEASKRAIENVELDYWVQNHQAREFYKKHGFQLRREFVYKKL